MNENDKVVRIHGVEDDEAIHQALHSELMRSCVAELENARATVAKFNLTEPEALLRAVDLLCFILEGDNADVLALWSAERAAGDTVSSTPE